MMSSVIPARLVYQCGHAALVSLPRVKGESSPQRADRVAREKSEAHTRACDFCAQRLEVVVQQAAPAPVAVPVPIVPPPPVAVPAPVRLAVVPAPETPSPVAPIAELAPVETLVALPVAAVVSVPAAPRRIASRRNRVAKHVAKPTNQNGQVASGARFVVEFQVETVVRAADLADALRQAQALGAIEVLSISDAAT